MKDLERDATDSHSVKLTGSLQSVALGLLYQYHLAQTILGNVSYETSSPPSRDEPELSDRLLSSSVGGGEVRTVGWNVPEEHPPAP